MEPFFYQDGNTTVQFNGEHIAHVSSDSPSKQRYTEFDLFISENDEWVLQGVGRTKIDGEKDRYWTIVSSDPNDVLEALWVKSRATRKLLSEALIYLSELVNVETNQMDKDSIIEAAAKFAKESQGQPMQPQVVQPQPAPMSIQMEQAVDPQGNKLVVLIIHHPLGQNVFFLNPDGAEHVGNGLLDAARLARTGLEIPRLH